MGGSAIYLPAQENIVVTEQDDVPAERYRKHGATLFVGGQCARTSTRKAKVYRTGPGFIGEISEAVEVERIANRVCSGGDS